MNKLCSSEFLFRDSVKLSELLGVFGISNTIQYSKRPTNEVKTVNRELSALYALSDYQTLGGVLYTGGKPKIINSCE